VVVVDTRTRKKFEIRAKVMKALAHPTRLFIVDELSRSPKCVNELAEMVGADMSTISKHLSIMKNAGIIQNQKDGLNVFYSLKSPCVLNFFKCVERVIETNVKENLSLMR
jgi:ArsR family transcriptional regulator